MPTFVHGKDTKVLLDEFDVSNLLNRISPNPSRDMHDSTTFGNDSKVHQPGLRHGTLNAEGFYLTSATSGSLNSILGSIPQTPKIVTGFPEGYALGKPAYMALAHSVNYAIESMVADLVKNSANFQCSEDGIERGVSLHALSAETGTVNGTSVDNAVSSANGGVAVLHLSAIAGAAPSVVIKVQHSTNDSVWADLTGATFTAATAATKERLEVAAGTTVNRYLRIVCTFGGTTTSVTFNVSFARR